LKDTITNFTGAGSFNRQNGHAHTQYMLQLEAEREALMESPTPQNIKRLQDVNIEIRTMKNSPLYDFKTALDNTLKQEKYVSRIDALENDQMCFLAELGNDQGHPEHADHILNREWGVLHEAPDGYNHTWYTDEVRPRDIYDEFNLRFNFDTNEIEIPIKGWENEGRTDVTWDDVKEIRNKMLHDTDGKISADMPQEIQDKWLRYRQLLRDLPTALAEYPAWVAAKMWPTAPDFRPPADPTDKSSASPT
jgi:hypothetical protein